MNLLFKCFISASVYDHHVGLNNDELKQKIAKGNNKERRCCEQLVDI